MAPDESNFHQSKPSAQKKQKVHAEDRLAGYLRSFLDAKEMASVLQELARALQDERLLGDDRFFEELTEERALADTGGTMEVYGDRAALTTAAKRATESLEVLVATHERQARGWGLKERTTTEQQPLRLPAG